MTYMIYKGYEIQKVTRLDWMVRDKSGNVVFTEQGRLTSRTLRDAKQLIDGLNK